MYHHVANNGGKVNPLREEDDIDLVGNVVSEIAPVSGREDVVGENSVKDLGNQPTVLV